MQTIIIIIIVVIIIIPRRRRRDIDLALSVRLFVRSSVTNLLGLYLKDYYRFEHETSGVYTAYWGEVHCTRTITLHFLILELLPFVIFKDENQSCTLYVIRQIPCFSHYFSELMNFLRHWGLKIVKKRVFGKTSSFLSSASTTCTV